MKIFLSQQGVYLTYSSNHHKTGSAIILVWEILQDFMSDEKFCDHVLYKEQIPVKYYLCCVVRDFSVDMKSP